jgi:hypothetical protein
MIIAILISIIVAILGWLGIQYTGNYENVWGMMLWYGLGIACILIIIGIVLSMISLIALI